MADKFLISIDADRKLIFWDLKTKEFKQIVACDKAVNSISLSQDNRFLAISSFEHIRIYFIKVPFLLKFLLVYRSICMPVLKSPYPQHCSKALAIIKAWRIEILNFRIMLARFSHWKVPWFCGNLEILNEEGFIQICVHSARHTFSWHKVSDIRSDPI